jgi:hypothetical protein
MATAVWARRSKTAIASASAPRNRGGSGSVPDRTPSSVRKANSRRRHPSASNTDDRQHGNAGSHYRGCYDCKLFRRAISVFETYHYTYAGTRALPTDSSFARQPVTCLFSTGSWHQGRTRLWCSPASFQGDRQVVRRDLRPKSSRHHCPQESPGMRQESGT